MQPSLPDPSIELPESSQQSITEQLQEWVKLKPDMIGTMKPQPDYWKSRLANAPTLELPTDKPRPAIQSFRGATEEFSLPADLAAGLKDLSRREGANLFMLLLTAFKVLLYRYSGQNDIVIGTPTAGQSRLELDGLNCFFVNTLVLRTDLSGNPSFCKLLAQVRGVTLEAYVNQDTPFEKLVETLNLQRDLSRNPLFQVMFIVHDLHDDKQPLNENTPEFLQTDTGTTQLDLSLELSETPHGLAGRVKYATDLFEAATIGRLIGHFQTLLEGIVALPEARLSELPLLAQPERRQLLLEWNDTAASFPRDKCIHALFEAQAAATPQAVAVMHRHSRLSYAELNAQANQLAHHLGELGVKPDTLVAISMERSINLMIGLLAILKAGGAYVPLDSAYPEERLAFMLEDSAPVALLTQGQFKSLFADMAKTLPVIDLEADAQLWAHQPDTNPDRHKNGLKPKHLAYVIYTSGSTGQPKGVTMPHEALVNLITWQLGNTRVAATARTLQYSPISFDVSFQELFSTWCGGGTLVLVDETTRRDPSLLLQYLDRQRIERLFLPFIALEQLARFAVVNEHFPDSLREVITAGEQLRITPEVRSLFANLGDCRLVNQYGPSETHVVTAFPLPDKCTDWEALPSIGRPVANTQIYILDRYGNPVPIGVTGELYIGGTGVARGYLGRAKLSAERFLPDPFAQEPAARIYKTGDLARWLADGTIEYLGRNDFQVKIRGFRIEIGEIETILRQHPQLREATVGVYEPVPEDKRLVAYLVTQDTTVPSIAELRDFLKPKLPEFMMPSVFMFLDALPITPNGKLDRKALPKPDQNRQVQDTDFIAPRNPVERRLAEIWRAILKIDRVGIHDNFFDLGGHSLLAVDMMVQVNKLFDADLPLAVIYQSPTLEKMGITISSGNRQSSWYSLVPIHTQGSRPPLFAIHTISLLDLPQYLGKDQPLYFLRYAMATGVSNHSVSLPPLEELAKHYIQELQQVQPHGPYYLIGFSFGGVIAYEMANQLLANGHRVNLLGLLDTCLTEEKQLRPLPRIIHNFFKLSPSQLLDLVKNKITDMVTPYKYGTDFWPHIYTPAPDIACFNGYQPKSYNGQVTLFQGWERESKLFSYAPPEQGWKKLLGDRLEVQQISGEHLDICREPHVKTLAEKLIACMDKAINDR